jgi:hypothetical protein
MIPLPGWHEIGVALRNKRLGVSPEVDAVPETLGDLVTVEQYLCVRPLPLPGPPAGTVASGTAGGADDGQQGAENWRANHAAHRDPGPKGNGASAKGNGAAPKPNVAHETQAKRPPKTTQAASGALHEERPRPQ